MQISNGRWDSALCGSCSRYPLPVRAQVLEDELCITRLALGATTPGKRSPPEQPGTQKEIVSLLREKHIRNSTGDQLGVLGSAVAINKNPQSLLLAR